MENRTMLYNEINLGKLSLLAISVDLVLKQMCYKIQLKGQVMYVSLNRGVDTGCVDYRFM